MEIRLCIRDADERAMIFRLAGMREANDPRRVHAQVDF